MSIPSLELGMGPFYPTMSPNQAQNLTEFPILNANFGIFANKYDGIDKNTNRNTTSNK